MTWEAHADHLVKRISKKLFVLRQLRSEVNVKTLLTAYYALVHSNITYAKYSRMGSFYTLMYSF
jgi:hypothetical protein